VLRSSCARRLLPHDLLPWKTFYHDFCLWRLQDIWDKLHAMLHVAVNVRAGRDPQQSGGDSR
jgi:transposase